MQARKSVNVFVLPTQQQPLARLLAQQNAMADTSHCEVNSAVTFLAGAGKWHKMATVGIAFEIRL